MKKNFTAETQRAQRIISFCFPLRGWLRGGQRKTNLSKYRPRNRPFNEVCTWGNEHF